ncbi:hypothetical protein, partial [Clostridium beijerinckii]|uniref:hypothetical protein n=1 Tax=Clostridium beijerinckii TaxID=1520 RepID=UPI001A9A6850
IRNLMVLILRLKVVPSMLGQSMPLRLAYLDATCDLRIIHNKFLRNWNNSIILISARYMNKYRL